LIFFSWKREKQFFSLTLNLTKAGKKNIILIGTESNATKILGIKNINANTNGNNIVQQATIS